ncbi:response regulator [Pseudomonas schmalbachii]|uniref:Response regulator transcription factor n=1 Tax=Pseudomonas schmalbachii TaxID=2816993 RepID=A0ABS3TTP4_9PSED|nr:response regulator transcription factor [Pseudomonas schmalbachii]MBO3277030.1 response regulator transcription factor [Pseudomonas schmalbachii]
MRKVLVVDDQPLVCLAIRELVEGMGHEVVGEASNGRDALAMAESLKPDLVILEPAISSLEGLDVLHRLASLKRPLDVLVFTGESGGGLALRCIQAGAAGFVCKQCGLDQLKSAIFAAISGYSVFPNLVGRLVVNSGKSINEYVLPITSREAAILRLLAGGASYRHISDALGISIKTVSAHKRNMERKLDVQSMAELLEMARSYSLV